MLAPTGHVLPIIPSTSFKPLISSQHPIRAYLPRPIFLHTKMVPFPILPGHGTISFYLIL